MTTSNVITLGICEKCNQGPQRLFHCPMEFGGERKIVTKNGIKTKTIENLFCNICLEMHHQHTGESWA